MRSLRIWVWNNLHITLLLLLVWLISFGARYNHLELVAVNSDSLSPYVAAMRFWMQGWSDPPNPESDHWMWLTTMPWIWLSDSLYQLFLLRFFWGSLIAPVGALCFFLLAPRNRYLGAAVVGFLLALDKGLIDTLVSSFRGYMAPEFIALASLAIVLNEKGYRYGLFASLFFCIVAAGHHPMALASLAGWFLYALHAKMSLKEWGICLAILFISSIFRLIWLFEIAQCDAGGLQCFEIIAMGSSETALTIKEMFVRIVHDRFLTEIGWVSICVVIGVYCARKNRITLWLIGGIIGLFCLGVSISTLRPYHFRIFALPMFLVSILGWMSLQRYLRISIIFLIPLIWYQTPHIWGESGGLRRHDDLAEKLMLIEGTRWVEADTQSTLSASGVVLSAILQGEDTKSFPAAPSGNLIVLTEKGIQDFGSVDVAISTIPADMLLVGGYDWAVMLHSEEEIKLLERNTE